MRNAIGGFGLVWVAALGLLASGAVWAPEAGAGLDVPDPGLPPVTGEWVSDPDTQILSYGGVITGRDVHLFGFENIVRADVGADEYITCDALLTAVVTYELYRFMCHRNRQADLREIAGRLPVEAGEAVLKELEAETSGTEEPTESAGAETPESGEQESR